MAVTMRMPNTVRVLVVAAVIVAVIVALFFMRGEIREPTGVDVFDPTMATTEEDVRAMCANSAVWELAGILGTEDSALAVVDALVRLHPEERRVAVFRGCWEGLDR